MLWCHRGDCYELFTPFSLLYTIQKEESLVQPHNIINDCICNIS